MFYIIFYKDTTKLMITKVFKPKKYLSSIGSTDYK